MFSIFLFGARISVEKIEGIISEGKSSIRDFLKGQVRANPGYARFNMEFREVFEKQFSRGERQRDSYVRQLFSRLENFDGKKIGYMAHSMDDWDVEVADVIETTKVNRVNVPITVPEKTMIFPEKSSMGKIRLFYLPDHVERELKECSKAGTSSPLKVGYTLENIVSYSLDSNGVEVLHSLPTFSASLQLDVFRGENMYRGIGIVLGSDKDFDKMNLLIKYVPDITLEGVLRSSKSFEELAVNMDCVGKSISRNRVRAPDGIYSVVCPYTVFAHEIYGHSFEDEVSYERGFFEETNYNSSNLFSKGMRVAPKFFSLIDDPTIRLENLRLYGSFDFDSEMFEGRKKVLIDKGVVSGVMLGSRYSDGDEVGNAKIDRENIFPIARMSTTYVPHDRRGPKTLEELAEMKEDRDVIFTIKHEGYCDPDTGFFVVGDPDSEGSNMETYLYKNGTLMPVKSRHIMSGAIYNSLYGIHLSSNALTSYDVGRCGKDSVTSMDDTSWVDASQLTPMALLPSLQFRTYTPRKI